MPSTQSQNHAAAENPQLSCSSGAPGRRYRSGSGPRTTLPRQNTCEYCGTLAVHVRRDGRKMLYRTNAEAIRPLHEWTSTFERFWRRQLASVKERAEQKAKESEKSQ